MRSTKNADYAQKKSVVLLQNTNKTLPLAESAAQNPIALYVMGMDENIAGDDKLQLYRDFWRLRSGRNASTSTSRWTMRLFVFAYLTKVPDPDLVSFWWCEPR
ncbi:hypothetical protein OH492_12170 [Vibrio chagasii]|nr:hypothetical protein [Vibrio chagasii]